MEAPTPPFDITVTFGSDQNTQNLMKLQYEVSIGQQPAKNFAKNRGIALSEQAPNDLYLIFDFSVEEGRQKEGAQYFRKAINNPQDKTLSPLQRAFIYKPSEQKIKHSIEEHKGFVRIFYQIMAQGSSEMQEFIQQFQFFENSGIDPSIQVDIQLKGTVSHNKKNRQNVKVDYATCHILGQKAFTPQLVDMMISTQMYEPEELLMFNPYLDLIRKVKKLKTHIKFDSFRKINRFYNSVAYEEDEKKPETKGFPYINQGIFRQKAEFSAIFKNNFIVNLTANYESEDVFIRLIKVYGATVSKLAEIQVFRDDD